MAKKKSKKKKSKKKKSKKEEKILYEVKNIGRLPKRVYGKDGTHTLIPGDSFKSKTGYTYRGIPNIEVTQIKGTKKDEEKVTMPNGKVVKKLKPDRIDVKVEKEKARKTEEKKEEKKSKQNKKKGGE